MNNRAHIKKKLLIRKKELEDELFRLDSERVSSDVAQDPVDQAMISNLEDLNLSIQKNEQDEYKMIMKALEMLEAGTYGICIDCNEAISEKRLQLYYNATRCITCQELYENE